MYCERGGFRAKETDSADASEGKLESAVGGRRRFVSTAAACYGVYIQTFRLGVR